MKPTGLKPKDLFTRTNYSLSNVQILLEGGKSERLSILSKGIKKKNHHIRWLYHLGSKFRDFHPSYSPVDGLGRKKRSLEATSKLHFFFCIRDYSTSNFFLSCIKTYAFYFLFRECSFKVLILLYNLTDI